MSDLIRTFTPASWENETGPGSAPTLTRPLNRLLDLTERGLAVKATRVCSVVGCEDPAGKVRGWCSGHYMRWRRTGDVGPAAKRSVAGGTCSVPNCDRDLSGRGYCKAHLKRFYLGDLRLDVPLGARRSPVPGYSAVHLRLQADRGHAADHPCATCGDTAKEWAYLGGDPDERRSATGQPFSADQARYAPLCTPCHRQLDLGSAS